LFLSRTFHEHGRSEAATYQNQGAAQSTDEHDAAPPCGYTWGRVGSVDGRPARVDRNRRRGHGTHGHLGELGVHGRLGFGRLLQRFGGRQAGKLGHQRVQEGGDLAC
jgi:hypothetical protein